MVGGTGIQIQIQSGLHSTAETVFENLCWTNKLFWMSCRTLCFTRRLHVCNRIVHLRFMLLKCERILAGRPAFTPCVLGYFLGGKAPSGLLKVGRTEYFQRRLYVLKDISLFPKGIMLVMALILHGPPFVQRGGTAVIVAVQNNVFNPSLFSVTHGMSYVILGPPWVVRISQKRANVLGTQTALLK